MKKTWLMAISSMLLSMTGTVGSNLIELPTFIWARSASNSSAHCILVGTLCRNNGNSICRILVPLPSFFVTPTQVFRDSPSCTFLVYDDKEAVWAVDQEETILEVVVK